MNTPTRPVCMVVESSPPPSTPAGGMRPRAGNATGHAAQSPGQSAGAEKRREDAEKREDDGRVRPSLSLSFSRARSLFL